jgi:lysozyme family protein
MEDQEKDGVTILAGIITALFVLFSNKKGLVYKSPEEIVAEQTISEEDDVKTPLPLKDHKSDFIVIQRADDEYTNKFLDFKYLNDEWEARAEQAVEKMFVNKSRYESLVKSLGLVPWYVPAIVHYLEGNMNFSTHLHNGDSLKRKTVNEPSGRPVFAPSGSNGYTWEESAIDAIKMKNWHTFVDWTVKDVLFRLELYNGRGYKNKGLASPYIWSGSNFGVGLGKFVKDGVYSKTAVSNQIGAALLLRKILERLNVSAPIVSVVKEKLQPKPQVIKIEDPLVVLPSSSKEDKLSELFVKHGIKFFKPKEFLTLGGGNTSGKCAGKNTLPPDDILENIARVAKYWDIVRERYGKPITVNSVYRSPAYNACLDGTASNSFHMKGMAADCSPVNGNISELAQVIAELKKEGKIVGGWGVYPTFIHLDTRPNNVKFR